MCLFTLFMDKYTPFGRENIHFSVKVSYRCKTKKGYFSLYLPASIINEQIKMELKTQYQQRVDETERELQIVRNKILRISSLRVVLFLAGIFGVIYGYDAGAAALCLITALTFVPFLILVKFHNRLFFRKEWLETCIRVNQDEISALDNNYEPFDEGTEFINAGHRYSLDLDIFGHHSLFQAMNRTCTSFGKNKLAEWLQEP